MTLFCLVHGAYQGASSWDLLIPELEARGHKAVAMDLPIENPSATLSDFADAVIQALPKAEDDIVLVGHSMAGTVIPIVASRRRVRKLVFLGALIPHPGTSTVDQFFDEMDSDMLKEVGYKLPAASIIDRFRSEPNMFNPAALKDSPDDTLAMELLFHDCEPDVARWAVSKLRVQKTMAPFFDVTPLQVFPDVECAYIVCADDRTVSPAWSRYAARKRLGVDAIEVPGGHCPHISRPAQLASILQSGVGSREWGSGE